MNYVHIGIQTKPNKGKFRVAVNGVDQGVEVDEYSPAVGYTETDGDPDDPSGTPSIYVSAYVGDELTFTVSGKNPSSTGYTLAFDYIRLEFDGN